MTKWWGEWCAGCITMDDMSMPVAEQTGLGVVSLSAYAALSPEDLKVAVEAVNGFLEARNG